MTATASPVSVPAVPPQDIAVIGAGIVGIATALTLQGEGHRVTLIDPRDPGSATSFGNAGVIANSGVTPVAMPGLWRKVPGMLMDPDSYLQVRWSYLPRLFPWLWRFLLASTPGEVERLTAELAPLVLPSFAAHDALLRRYAIDGIVSRVGWLKVYSQAGFDDHARERDLWRRNGVKFDELNADELRQLEPALSRGFERAIFHPDAAFVSTPLRLSQAYVHAFRAGGGGFSRERVTAIAVGGGGAPEVTTDKSTRRFDRAVIAAGSWSKPLAAMLGARVPLDTERGYHIYLKTGGGARLTRPTLISDHGFVMAPMEDGIRVTSGVEFAGLDAPPDYARVRRVATLAQKALQPGVLAGTDGAPEREWLGFRPSLPDSKPVIGPAPASERVLLAFGHGHLGLTLSAITGRCVADLIAGRKPSIPLAPFSATRF